MQFVILMMEESLMNVLLELGQAYAQIVLKDFRAPQRGGIFFSQTLVLDLGYFLYCLQH